MFLSSVCEREGHRKERHNKINIEEKSGCKECEVKLGQKWMKNTSENSVQ